MRAARRAPSSASHGWAFPVLADTSGTAGESYGLVGLPTSFVLDPEGRIVATFRGPQSEATLRQALLARSLPEHGRAAYPRRPRAPKKNPCKHPPIGRIDRNNREGRCCNGLDPCNYGRTT